MTMTEAKALGTKGVGEQFECPTGAIGTILPDLSAHGKAQATLTCTHPGCETTHVRESSDWHQCRFCEAHKKTGKKTGGGPKVRTLKTEDGTTIREQVIGEKDDEETRALKARINETFEVLWAEKEAKKAETKSQGAAQKELKKIQAEAEKAEKARKLLMEKAELICRVAAEKGVAISVS